MTLKGDWTPEQIDDLGAIESKLNIIGEICHLLVDVVGDNNPEFQKNFIATLLANNKIRHEFTEFINQTDDIDMITKMMALNEDLYTIRESGNGDTNEV
tara:strand:+ start:16 stop:312 length:297 start_codon:yes stop_codon:yes gene_type:complete